MISATSMSMKVIRLSGRLPQYNVLILVVLSLVFQFIIFFTDSVQLSRQPPIQCGAIWVYCCQHIYEYLNESM